MGSSATRIGGVPAAARSTPAGGITEAERSTLDRIEQIERRLVRLEALLDRIDENALSSAATQPAQIHEQPPGEFPSPRTGDAIEFELGQNWFALAGVAALTAGLAFLISLPHARLPAGVPAAGGVAIALGLLGAAQLGKRAFPIVVPHLRGAATVLLGFATLRLFHFGTPVLDINGTAGRLILLGAIAANLAIALHQPSVWLGGLSLVIAATLALSTGSAAFLLPVLVGLAVLGTATARARKWEGLIPFGLVVTLAAYFAWALGIPAGAGRGRFVAEPGWSWLALLGLGGVWGLAPLLRRPTRGDDAFAIATAVLSCTLGYTILLLHTAAAFPSTFAAAHMLAAALFLALAVAFRQLAQSRISTFFYAMTGHAALSMAILKLAPTPDRFVWLSIQSVLVVATAIWFRSRFIVVANFFMFAAIITGYLVVTTRETGISIGFGLVALASARILSWQRDRLELKTELMRNVYLVSAFFMFPYAVYHLVAQKLVALAWVGLAALYYLLGHIIRSPKYRWMGHGTIGLATLYLVSVGVSRFEPVYRVLSFLGLGTVLLIVSLWFSRARKRAVSADRSTR